MNIDTLYDRQTRSPEHTAVFRHTQSDVFEFLSSNWVWVAYGSKQNSYVPVLSFWIMLQIWKETRTVCSGLYLSNDISQENDITKHSKITMSYTMRELVYAQYG